MDVGYFLSMRVDKFGIILCLLSASFHTGLLLVFQTLLQPLYKTQEVWRAANWLVSTFQAVCATLMGIYSIKITGGDIIDTRIPFLKIYAWFSLGYWLYDFVCLFILAVRMKSPDDMAGKTHCDDDDRLDHRRRRRRGFVGNLVGDLARFVRWWPGIVFHHVGIVVFLVLGILATRRVRGDGIIGMALLMEFSTIFVALRSALGNLGHKTSHLYLVVSIAMVASFFLARILLTPYIIQLYCSLAGVGLWSGVAALPAACQVGTLSFYSLNLYWFHLMVKGALKAIKTKSL